MMTDVVMVVIGAGAYGTALAVRLAQNGHKVLLWGRSEDHIQKLKVSRCNQDFLPGITFPPSLFLESSLPVALSICKDIIIAVPSNAFTSVIVRMKPFIRIDTRIVLATKGLEPKTGRLLQDVVYDIFGYQIPFAIISGPTFARELAMGLPTVVSLAVTDLNFSTDLQDLLNCSKNFRVYSSVDFIGIQLAGAVKNIIAIGAGISDGLGFGANARTALITRGVVEMSRLGRAMGAESSIFMGMAGLGDLILTCTDNQSRNRRFGLLLGKGYSIEEAKNNISQVVEGLCNTKEVCALSKRYDVEMPIVDQVYEVLYQNQDPNEAALNLLKRAQKDDRLTID